MTTETPVQVPPPEPVRDPLYGHIIGTLEGDLAEMKERALKAEAEAERLGALEKEIEALANIQTQMKAAIDLLNVNVNTLTEYTKAIYNTNQRVFRTG